MSKCLLWEIHFGFQLYKKHNYNHVVIKLSFTSTNSIPSWLSTATLTSKRLYLHIPVWIDPFATHTHIYSIDLNRLCSSSVTAFSRFGRREVEDYLFIQLILPCVVFCEIYMEILIIIQLYICYIRVHTTCLGSYDHSQKSHIKKKARLICITIQMSFMM